MFTMQIEFERHVSATRLWDFVELCIKLCRFLFYRECSSGSWRITILVYTMESPYYSKQGCEGETSREAI